MPKLRLTMPIHDHSWTKVPNLVFDNLMPTLKDTELRILLILIRSTSGWNRSGSPVILPYHQLKKRAGRGSEAISKAIAELSRLGLIHKRQPITQTTTGKSKHRHRETEEQQYKERD